VSQGNLHMDSDILTTNQAAEFLAKSDAYLRNNYQRLGIRAYRIGNQLRFRRSELVEWLDNQVA
jgi:excisionase family DNA binding protein